MNFKLNKGEINESEYDREFNSLLDQYQADVHEINKGIVAKQLRLHKYTVSLLNVVDKNTEDPDQRASIYNEILKKYEYSIGKNVTMNQGYKVKKALELGNLYDADFFYFKEFEPEFLNNMGYKGSMKEMMDAYLKDLITEADQNYE
jgi:hypothetical protein